MKLASPQTAAHPFLAGAVLVLALYGAWKALPWLRDRAAAIVVSR